MENDYAAVRAFKGQSSLKTYLVTVVTHYFQDWQNARWGKWRPSAEARRLGPIAVQLETLTMRDQLTFEQAYETLRTDHGVTESRAELEAMAARFPARAPRTFVSDDGLEHTVGTLQADQPLAQRQAADSASVASKALDAALRALPNEDRVIIKLRFDHDTRVIDIAKALGLEQKALYRRIDKLLRDLRASLAANGVDADRCREAFEGRGFEAMDAESSDPVRPFVRGVSSQASPQRWS